MQGHQKTWDETRSPQWKYLLSKENRQRKLKREVWEDMKKYSPNIPYKDYFPKQFNPQYFDQFFNLMVDLTYQGTYTIQATGETIL